jgi:hypothetical protein
MYLNSKHRHVAAQVEPDAQPNESLGALHNHYLPSYKIAVVHTATWVACRREK